LSQLIHPTIHLVDRFDISHFSESERAQSKFTKSQMIWLIQMPGSQVWVLPDYNMLYNDNERRSIRQRNQWN